MAEYNINFSTNASRIAKELSEVQTELAKAVQMAKPGGLKIQLSLDASGLEESINTTFRKINKAIESNQRKLSRLQIGGANFRMIAERLGTAEGQRERGRAIAKPIRLRAQAAAFEPGSLTSMQKVLQALRIEASQITPNTVEWVRFQQQIGEVTLELKQADKAAESIQLTQQLGALAPGSLSRLDKQLTILKNRARDITPNTVEWKKLNKEIQKVETSIAKVSKKPLSAGQRAGAAGGAFLYGGGMGGGVGSAFGGIAGGLMGGVPGAFTGAAIGQAVDSLGGALAGITSQAAAVQQLQRGLALASIDAKDFAEAQSAVADVSSRLFIPLEQVTKSFAQLRVNTKQYGLSVEETKQILEGTILAVSAFGGSADDVDGAMRAVVQILSKGSVQAEELRGQLGERFPGAVIKFAQANKLSFNELQDRLKEGTIGIKEFVTFAKDNYEDYAEFSKTIATAPEFAGRRLAKALEETQMVIGQVFGASGATIQDFTSQALQDITKFVVDNKELLAKLAQDFAVVFAGIMSVVAEAGKFIIKVLAPVLSYIGSVIRQLRVMTGAADAATAKAEMNAANVIIQRTGMGRDAFLTEEPRPGSFADKIEFDMAQERYRRAEKRFKDAGGEAALPPETGTPPDLVFGGAGAGVSIDAAAPSGGSGGNAANDAQRAAEQAAQAEQRIQDQLRALTREIELNGQLSAIKELQFQAEMDGNKELQARLQGEERTVQILQATAQSLDGITDERLRQKTLAKAESEIASSRQETIFDMQRIEAERTKAFNEIIADLDLELALKTATTEQAREQLRLEAELAKLRGQGFTPDQIDAIATKKTELAAPKTDAQSISATIVQLQEEIRSLTSISNIAITSAEGIGSAFATSFKGLIDGSMSAKEALGSFFKSVADMFLEMAAQIIAKQITMIILQTILKALGAVAGGGGAMPDAAPQMTPDAIVTPTGFSGQFAGIAGNGATFANGIASFARGGAFSNSIVSSPTMFKFADGGAMRTGLMGEAGPEAIMPLKRGADGSLGVQANGLREAMDRQQGGANGSPVLNMSFQSTSINGVEYVSRDQLESAMAETRRNATRDGAKRGMTMTLDRIQNSSSTRRKVGI
jgi:tape measure domain-containing protein